MKFTQIGNGSALIPTNTNSSFVITGTKHSMLIDCGTNVYAKLYKDYPLDIKKFKYIFITHMDDDHIGSLRSFMYHLYFKCNVKPCIIVDESLKEDMLHYLKDHRGLVVDYQKDNSVDLYDFIAINNDKFTNIDLDDEDTIGISSFQNKHFQSGSGISILNKSKATGVSITGDTVPCKEILDEFNDMSKECPNFYKMYHDFSSWDKPSMQVHSCKSAMELMYPKAMIKKLKLYHNDSMIKPRQFQF